MGLIKTIFFRAHFKTRPIYYTISKRNPTLSDSKFSHKFRMTSKLRGPQVPWRHADGWRLADTFLLPWASFLEHQIRPRDIRSDPICWRFKVRVSYANSEPLSRIKIL